MENEEKVFAHGYKGFNKGMVCNPDGDHSKQYAENTVFEEDNAEICKSGMHFCAYPLDVFKYYPPVKDGVLNEFAEVEALSPVMTDDNKKFCTTKLSVKSKINFAELCDDSVKFIMDQIDNKKKQHVKKGYRSAATNTGDQSAATNTGYQSAATNTGNYSAATNTGSQSAATNTGNRSAATNTGSQSAAEVNGKESFAVSTGYKGKAKGAIGCWIACAEWGEDDTGEYHPVDFKVARIDGQSIKANVFYQLQNGIFIEAE